MLGLDLTRSGTGACFLGWLTGPSLGMLLLDVLPVENTLTDVSGSSENSMLVSETSVSLDFL